MTKTDRVKTGPTRTCVGCRSKAAAHDLMRLRLDEQGRVVNASVQDQGRGAWLHPRQECFDRATSTAAWSRAFRRAVEVPAWSGLCPVKVTGTSDYGSGLEADGHPMSTQR